MKRQHRFLVGVFGALGGVAASLLAPSAASAQATPTSPPSSEDEILVTGVRNQLKLADRFVDGLTIARSSDPLARYEEGTYCPAVLGLSERFDALIATRMRKVAASAGVVPARLGCVPSALVIFAENKNSLLAAFRKLHPIYFADLQRKEHLPPPEAGPAIAWHLVQLFDPQGNPVRRSPSGVGTVESSFGGSRLRSMVKSVVVMSVVVIERKALLGLTATQVADYALMRSLTDRVPNLARTPTQVTILGALTAPMGTPTPASLTKWDLAYLQGRYSGDAKAFGHSQRATIRRNVRRAAQGKSGEE